MRLSHPRLRNRSPTSTPSWWKIREFVDRWIKVDDFLEAYDSGLFSVRVLRSEELPTMVILIMSDVQDRTAAKHDPSE